MLLLNSNKTLLINNLWLYNEQSYRIAYLESILTSNLKQLLVACALASLLSACVAHIDERSFIHPRPGTTLTDSLIVDGGWRIQSVNIARGDANLYGALFHRADAKALVLYFPGSAFVLSEGYSNILAKYRSLPVDVLIVDYRGYGASTGVASIDGLLSDALPVYDYARALAPYQSLPVMVHGHSLGSFMAGAVAHQRKIDALILESSATSAEEWVQSFVDDSIWIRRGVIEGSLQGKGNLALMATLNEPVLFIVGANDQTTRPEMSSKLFAAANVPSTMKQLLIVPGADHRNASLDPRFGAAILRLIAKRE
jgi:uncharacterized protein